MPAPRTGPLTRPFLGFVWAVTAGLVVTHLIVPAGPAADATYLAVIIGAPVVALLGMLSAPPHTRRVLGLVTAGLAFSALGDTLWMVYVWTDRNPDVSWADVPFYVSYLGIGGAMLAVALNRRTALRPDVDAAIDALTVVVVSVVLLGSVSVPGIMGDHSVGLFSRVVLAGYPVLDAVLLALILRILSVRAQRAVLGVRFAVGIGCWLASDLGYLLFAVGETVSVVLDVGWMVGGMLMATSTWRRPEVATEAPARPQVERPWLWRLGLAAAPLLVPFALLVAADLADHTIAPAEALVVAVALLGVTVVRMARLLAVEAATRRDLALARDEALSASQAKSRFLATMSHEIRTPMNGVLGLNELMLTTTLDDRQRQYAEGIRSAGHNLLDVINGVLDFSKIESGHLELESIDFDVVDLVEGVADLLAEPAQSKGLELLAYCSPELPAALRGDPSRIRQVLLNLAGNAVKFTGDGEVLIRAQLDARDAEELVVRFEVTDTGIGIAEHDQARLFEAFSQADSSTTRQYGGTGLGLAICQRIVDAMGGEIGLTSRPGSGSTFFFTVPLETAGDADAVRPRLPAGLAGRRVLVVDDNQTNRAILHDQLQHWGMSVHLADGAASALDRLRATARQGRRYDLVVLDLCMPDVDGLQLGRRIAAEPQLAPDRMILMTSGPDVTSAEAAAASIDVALTKPVLLSRLRKTLDSLFARPAPGTDRTAPLAEDREARSRVLVVEDGEVNQLVAVGMLKSLGHEAVVAESGRQALAMLRDETFDLVFMDVQMPGMDGYQTTREIRRLEDGVRHTPVVAMTATATPDERERCLDAGMDDHIAKPISRAVVAAALEQWVRATT